MGQNNVIDKIVAVIGEEYILKSDIENAYMQQATEYGTSISSKADILEQLLIQKLLCAEAKLDSIFVTEAEVESGLKERINQMADGIGSIEKLEKYFGSTKEQIAEDMRPGFRSMLEAQRMQSKIESSVRVTPAEVRAFYKKLPKDSLSEVPAKYEIQQIVMKPPISEAEKERCREQLRQIRERITKGESSFSMMAVLYSEDPGSASKGGELDFFGKSTMDPAFSDAAFSLRGNNISKIVETEYGFHIIQLIARRDDKVNARHILITPKVSPDAKDLTMKRMDSLRTMIANKEFTFEEAAKYFSSDKETRNNGGLMTDPMTGETRMPKTSISGQMARIVNEMNVGEISKPFTDKDLRNREEFKIVKVKAYYPIHKTNLEEDWSVFENALMNSKRQKALIDWIKKKQNNTYIHIDKEYQKAKFHYDGWRK